MIDQLDKKFYKIREVADMLQIPASTIRFWESRFSIITPHRNSSGTRFFTAEDIEKIRMIHYLVKEKGLKLEAAEAQLKNNREGVSRQREVLLRLQSVRERLGQLLQTLDRMK